MLKAERGFIDERSREEKKERFVNDEYLYKGPGTYIPRIEESVSLKLTAQIVLPENGLVIRAKRSLIDATGKKRVAGEKVITFILIFIQWLHKVPGFYLPTVDEDIKDFRKAYVLSDVIALHLRALKSFTD